MSRGPIPAQVLPLLYELGDTAESTGAAAITSSDFFPFSYTQAHTYKNYFDGLRRILQVDSLVQGLFLENSPYYGWGSYGYLEPSVPEPPELKSGEIPEDKKTRLAVLQKIPGRLEVHKRAYPAPSLAMMLIYATLKPQVIQNVTIQQVNSRRNRLAKQIKEPSLTEKLYKLRAVPHRDGVLVGIASYKIEKI